MRISRRSVLGAGVGVLAGLVVGCGDDEEPPSSRRSLGTASEPVDRFTIVAEDLRWNLDRIVVPTGQEVVATVDNRDQGVGHNLHVFLGDEGPKSPIDEGPVQQTLRFRIAEPGTYRFVCDPHAATMEGEIVAV